MMRIGVISDTHGLLRGEIMEELSRCDVILHAGDIHRQRVLEELRELAPVCAVRGNADKEWAQDLPETASPVLGGLRFFIIHNKNKIREDLSDRDIIVFGHTHKYEKSVVHTGQRTGGQLWLNPGGCGPRRFTQPITMAVIEADGDGDYHVKKIEIPHAPAKAGGDSALSAKDLPKNVVEAVIRDVDAGRSVSAIAKRNRIGEELAEQICRLYVTHPGIDAEGVMKKMS